uniref:6-phosphofructo-2-kinase/fructose-2,6-biphosphatase 2 n=1 Tax=Mus musculus TaxID=10090 RepID=A0A087WRW5_MOUSE
MSENSTFSPEDCNSSYKPHASNLRRAGKTCCEFCMGFLYDQLPNTHCYDWLASPG